MSVDLLPRFIRDNYEVHEWKHACAILQQDFASEWNDICEVLTKFRFKKSWITVGGGRKSKVSEEIDRELYKRQWVEKHFDTEILIDEIAIESPTHKIDCFKNRVALEIEWNNKDLHHAYEQAFTACPWRGWGRVPAACTWHQQKTVCRGLLEG
jgi:hypothetical protein